jgi:hypothetical protein
MATKSESFEDGQIASSEGQIYYAPTKSTFAKSVFLFNTSATTQTISLYVRRAPSATSRQFRQIVLKQYESADITPPLLSPGDSIRADTTTASVVDYVITGETVE